MAAILKVYNVKSKIRLRQSMRTYLKNIPVKFYPDPSGNDGVFGFLTRLPQKEQ